MKTNTLLLLLVLAGLAFLVWRSGRRARPADAPMINVNQTARTEFGGGGGGGAGGFDPISLMM